jgi:aspartyl protease family protein
VNSFLKTAMMVLVAAGSGFVGTQGMITFAPAPLRAAKAESVLQTSPIQAIPGPQSDAIARSDDGHYWAYGNVNGRSVRFLVDTGATAVALTPQDAEKLGFRAKDLKYSSNVITAGGNTRAAAIKLASLSVAGARLENVDALVIADGLDASLLGMSYLGRLTRFEVNRGSLVLQP